MKAKTKRKAKAKHLVGKWGLMTNGSAFAVWVAWGIYAIGDQYRVLSNMIDANVSSAEIASMQTLINTTGTQITMVALVWLLLLVGHIAFVRARHAEDRAIRATMYAQYQHHTSRLEDNHTNTDSRYADTDLLSTQNRQAKLS